MRPLAQRDGGRMMQQDGATKDGTAEWCGMWHYIWYIGRSRDGKSQEAGKWVQKSGK